MVLFAFLCLHREPFARPSAAAQALFRHVRPFSAFLPSSVQPHTSLELDDWTLEMDEVLSVGSELACDSFTESVGQNEKVQFLK